MLIHRDLAAGLQWSHSRGVIVRDVKPGNIMFDPKRNRGVLIDFGLAAREMDGYFSGGGTPWYVPPEYRLRRSGCIGDVWSLGVTLLYCLGIIPLPEDTRPSWRLEEVFRETKDFEMMIEWLKIIETHRENIATRFRVLRRMLEPNPSKRINSKDLVLQLEQLAESSLASLGRPERELHYL